MRNPKALWHKQRLPAPSSNKLQLLWKIDAHRELNILTTRRVAFLNNRRHVIHHYRASLRRSHRSGDHQAPPAWEASFSDFSRRWGSSLQEAALATPSSLGIPIERCEENVGGIVVAAEKGSKGWKKDEKGTGKRNYRLKRSVRFATGVPPLTCPSFGARSTAIGAR